MPRNFPIINPKYFAALTKEPIDAPKLQRGKKKIEAFDPDKVKEFLREQKYKKFDTGKKKVDQNAVQFTECDPTSDSIIQPCLLEGRLELANTALYECSCFSTGQHNRLLPGNLRLKIEKQIIDHIERHFKDKKVNILSLGSGGLMQDVILVAKLIKRGIRDIHLTMVDTIEERCLQDLDIIFAKFKELFPDLHLTYQSVSSIEQLDTSIEYDVLHAIDFEDFGALQDYSGRDDKNPGSFTTQQYRANIDLLKATNLLSNKPTSLALLSRGHDIISLTPNSAKPSDSKVYINLSQLECDSESVKLFYLNSDIANLFFNLDFLSKAKKPIIINERIIDPKDREAVELFLQRYQLDYTIMDETTALTQISKTNGIAVIMDYTVYDPKKLENPACNDFNKPNVSVIKIDWSKSKVENLTIQLYPPLLKLRFELISQQENTKQLLEQQITIKRAYFHGFFKIQTTSLSAYVSELIQGDDKSKAKAKKIIKALEEHNIPALTEALDVKRYKIDIFGSTTGSKIIAALEKSLPVINACRN